MDNITTTFNKYSKWILSVSILNTIILIGIPIIAICLDEYTFLSIFLSAIGICISLLTFFVALIVSTNNEYKVKSTMNDINDVVKSSKETASSTFLSVEKSTKDIFRYDNKVYIKDIQQDNKYGNIFVWYEYNIEDIATLIYFRKERTDHNAIYMLSIVFKNDENRNSKHKDVTIEVKDEPSKHIPTLLKSIEDDYNITIKSKEESDEN